MLKPLRCSLIVPVALAFIAEERVFAGVRRMRRQPQWHGVMSTWHIIVCFEVRSGEIRGDEGIGVVMRGCVGWSAICPLAAPTDGAGEI